MYGTYETIDDRPALTFERPLAHPVQRVWQAVTDPAELAAWFPSAVSGQVAPGGALTFDFPDGDMTLEGEVVELEPPRRRRAAPAGPGRRASRRRRGRHARARRRCR